MDGLEPAFLQKLMAAGDLPGFSALADRSKRTLVDNYRGTGASTFWFSGAIGAGPAHHARYSHTHFDPKTYNVLPFRTFNIPTPKAFWDTLDDRGKKIQIIDWHRTPFSKLKNGTFIDNWYGHEQPYSISTYPESTANDILNAYGSDPWMDHAKYDKSMDGHKLFLSDGYQRISKKVDYCIEQLANNEFDLFVPNFAELHQIGHDYLHVSDMEHPLFDSAMREALGDPLRETYQKIDEAITALIAAANDDTDIMLFAGPGMETQITANPAMDELTRRLDVGIETNTAPTEAIRTEFRQKFSHNARKRLAPLTRFVRQRFLDKTYLKRRFFAIPHNDNSGTIRINLKGREKYGIVSKGPELDALIDDLTDGLYGLRNADTGAPAVSDVVVTRDNFDGPLQHELPDIWVAWDRVNNRKNFTGICSDRIGHIDVTPSIRPGDHTQSGLFWSTGPNHRIFDQESPCMPEEITETIVGYFDEGRN